MGLFTQALSAVRWTTLSTAFVVGTELLRTVVLAHYLSPGDFGLMAMVTIPVGLAQLYLDLGVSGALIHRQDATKDQLSSLYWLNIISGLILFAIFWCGSSYVSLLFREPRITPLMKVVSLVFVITPLVSQFDTLLQKELAFRTLAIRDIIAGIGQTVVAIVCAVAGLGVWSLVFGFLAGMAFRAMLLAPIGLARFRPSFHFSKGDLKGYISFGLFQVGERSITYFEQRVDQMLLGYMVGAQGLGLYSFAFNLVAQPVWKINPILTKVAFPLFSKVQNDRARLKRGYMKLVGFISMVNAPLLIGLALVAPMMVPVVFGAKWSGSVLLIQILSLVSLMRSINNPLGSLQLAKGRADLGFWWHVVVTVATVPAVYLGAHFGQTTGVAVGMLVLQALLVVPAYVFLIRPFVGRCAREYASAILKPVGASCAMGVLIIALSFVVPISSEVFRLATQVTVGAIAYLALMRAFHKEALGEFSQLLPR